MKGKETGKIFLVTCPNRWRQREGRIELLIDLKSHLNTAPKPRWLDSSYLVQPDTTGYHVSHHVSNMPQHNPHYVWSQCQVILKEYQDSQAMLTSAIQDFHYISN